MSDTEQSVPKIEFKKKSRKPLRKREFSNEEELDDDDDNTLRDKLEELKTIQKLRQRSNGVKIDADFTGEKITTETPGSDPFNVKAGGMVNMAALKNAKIKQNDAYETGIGTQFNAETNKRDEDEEMVKYIEEHLSKRKRVNKEESEASTTNEGAYCSPEDAALQAVPDHLRQSSTYRSEEMLSNQMLSGIPEVDLGIEAKIKNIEATEEAKLKLLWDRHRKKDGPSQFVPTNMAVNFVQHNRFNIEVSDVQKNKNNSRDQRQTNSSAMNSKEKRKEAEDKATDDYHYERFKKQFRRF